MEHNNAQLAVRLRRRGIPVSYTAIGEGVYSQMPTHLAGILEVEELPWHSDRPISFGDWLKLMRQRPADVVVLPKNWWAKGGLPMVLAASLSYRRIVLREHVPAPAIPPRTATKTFGGLLPRLHMWYYRHLLYGRLLSTLPDAIICVSNQVRDRLVEQYGFPARRSIAIHNGVDCGRFRFNMGDRLEYRERWGIAPNAIVYGSVGRIQNRVKQHHWSLRGFARLVQQHPEADLRFLLVGEGPDRDAILALAEELGVASRCTVAPFSAAPWKVYSALDVFLLPSVFEGLSLAMLEAMASECCVIATAVGGAPEVLQESQVGWLVPAADERAFHAAMVEPLELGGSARRRVGERARALVLRQFNADLQYDTMIQRILGGPGEDGRAL